jgi:hypothetical protein
MRVFAFLLVACTSLCEAEAQKPFEPIVKVSLGVPALCKSDYVDVGIEGSLLVGSSRSPFRFGVQAFALGQVYWIGTDHPENNLSALYGVIGYELSENGLFTVIPFGGAGIATWSQAGRELSSTDYPEASTYQIEKGNGPSAVGGIEVGIFTNNRHFCGSITTGALISHHSLAFISFGFGIGNF